MYGSLPKIRDIYPYKGYMGSGKMIELLLVPAAGLTVALFGEKFKRKMMISERYKCF